MGTESFSSLSLPLAPILTIVCFFFPEEKPQNPAVYNPATNKQTDSADKHNGAFDCRRDKSNPNN